MWFVYALVIVVAIIIIIATVALIRDIHERGDYHDGGGKQVGGGERIPYFTPANERAGMMGEKLVNYHLRPLLRDDEYLLANLLLPLRNGHKTEVDCILISRKGIFCVETKYWVGHIIGDEEDEEWIQIYDDPDMDDRKHKNPVKQNEGHCATLERIILRKFNIDNVVIFANLEDGSGIHSEHALTISQFKNYYRELDDDEIPASYLRTLYLQLVEYVATPEELARHREETRRRFN